MRALLIASSALLLVVVGLVGFVPAFVEARAEQAIAASFDRVQTLDVDVDVSPIGLVEGRLDALRVRGEGLMLRGLRLSRLDARLRDVALDLRGLLLRNGVRLNDIREGEARAVIVEDALAAYLARDKGLEDVSVRLGDGTVTVSGRARVLEMSVVATVTGRFVVAGDALLLRSDTLTIRGITLRGPVADALIDRLNPILESRDLGLPLRLERVETQPGRLVIVAVP